MEKITNSLFKTTALSLAIILTFNPLLVAAADLTLDPNSGKTSIGQAGNGVPVININAPNSQGLSHNKFIDYNVGKQGLILNNNAQKYTNSQLGGIIENNPNFKGKAAGTILNEVTSGNASRLQGYTEVAGQKANVIVANPNGVTCSGCGFINTPRVTLTTGKPIIENGQINHYDVDKGKITVEGEGLNAGNISQFDLITRSTEINAEIHAQKLNVITGRNQVTHQDLSVTAKADDGSDKPQLAIDSSALGGMYAGAIRLVGTEQGVGVHLAGDMASHGGDIQLDANGKLTVTGTMASNQNIAAKASEIDLQNATYAANDINLSSQQTTVHQSLASGGHLTINTDQLTNKGIIEAGVKDNGTNAQLTLNIHTLNNQGKSIVSRGRLTITTQQINNQQGKIVSKQAAQITTEHLNNQQASLASEDKLTVNTTDQINNQQGSLIGQQGLAISATQLDNSNQGLIFSEKGNIALQADNLNNQLGSLAGQQLNLSIKALNNQLGLIEAAQGLNYQGNSLNNQLGTLHALGTADSQINLTDKLNNQQGQIGINSQTFTLKASLLDNTDGTINHQGNKGFNINADLLGAAGGKVTTQSALHIDQQDWYNNTNIQAAELTLHVNNLTQDQDGKLYLTAPLNITEGGDWYNDGLIQTNGEIHLTLQGDYWGTGQLLSASNIKLHAQKILLEGAKSRIQGNSNLDLTANDYFANEGNILSNKLLNLTAKDIFNAGTLGSSNTLTFTSNSLHNQDGFIFTGGQLIGKTDHLYNQRGDIYVQGDLNLTGKNQAAINQLTNHSGTIETLSNLFINANTLENAREVFDIITRKISARLDYLGCGVDCSGKRDYLYKLTEVDRTELKQASPESRIVAAGDLTLQSKRLDNQFSVIASGGNIQIDTNTFNNLGVQTGDVTTERKLLSWRTNSPGYMLSLVNTINDLDNPDSPHYDRNRDITNDISQLTSPLIMVINSITKGPILSNVQSYNGIVQATGSITINARDGQVANNSIKPSYIYTSGSNRVQDTTTPGNDIATYVPINAQLASDLTHQAVDPLNLPSFKLPSNINGLFHVSTNPKHNYLIETNPAFGLKSYLNSDYLLGKLGYNPDDIQKRLGDGFYEQRLIQQAIMARTGQYFVYGITDGDELYRYLMDNAIASQEELNLTIGVGLTADQIAKLTHDIVWLEEREVQGQKVLVPVIYMAQTKGRLAPNGSLIAGYNLALNLGEQGTLTNSGSFKADNALQAKANNIINSGLFESNALVLDAQSNNINTGGGIIKGNNISLNTKHGSIVNQRGVTSHNTQQGNASGRTDFVSPASSIESSGNLAIITNGGDIVNEGSNITAKTAQLQTLGGGEVILGSTSKIDGQQLTGKKSYYNQTVTQYGSQINVEDDLTIVSADKITTRGSSINVGGKLGMYAQGDVIFDGAANEQHSSSQSKTLTTQFDKITHQQSTITAGKIDVVSNNDINFGAATFTMDEGNFIATNKINGKAQQDTSYYLYDKKTGGSGSFSNKQTKKDEVTDVKNVSATFNVKGNLTFQSGGDQTYQAITINTPKGEPAGVVTFDSGGKIVFEGVKDLHQESHERSKSDWSWNSSKGKGNTDETFKQTTIIGDAKVVIKAVNGLHIDIKDNGINPQTVSQAIDAMVKADPGLAWIKEAEQRGDVDWRTVKEIHDQWQYQNSGLGVGASIVIAIAAAAVAGPAASGALAGAEAGTTAAAGGAVAGSMAGTGAVSLVNNKGNLGDTLKDTFSKDNLKNYVVAGITAGLTAEYFDKVFETKTNSIPGTNTTQVNPPSSLSTIEGLGKFAGNQLAQNTTSTALNKLLGRDVSWNDALKNSLYNTVSAGAFNKVGDIAKDVHLDSGDPLKIGMHAIVGGAVNEMMGVSLQKGQLLQALMKLFLAKYLM